MFSVMQKKQKKHQKMNKTHHMFFAHQHPAVKQKAEQNQKL